MKTIDISEFSAEQAHCCTLCPRNCRTDRTEKAGFCGERATARIARAALHMWEEPCISGKNGSGTVFFSGCSLKCVFCQNYAVSRSEKGRSVTADELVSIYFDLVRQGAHNINLVTPTHFAPVVTESVIKAKDRGIGVPFVWNSSGYETPRTLQLLEGLVDIYLPDMKYMDTQLAKQYSHAEDYPDVAKEALAEMVRQCPVCEFDERGIMKKGVIVRHLLLPGHVRNSKEVLAYLYETYRDQIYISIMSQYTPVKQIKKYPELNRRVTKREYERLLDFAMELGIENGFFQEGDPVGESFIPAFNGEGVRE